MWIKCCDKMPEKYEEVLFVACENHNREQMIGFRIGSQWVTTRLFYGCDELNDFVTVTHWQPLPEYPID